LLIRIRNLIEQQNFLEAEKAHQGQLEEQKNIVPSAQNQADTIFLSKALAQVEKHLNNPNYSVEQLSQDLHMDRTGLYRKLVNLLDKSPSLFIRNIRLEKAAEMLLEGKLNISEITDKIGFSSSSYFSKCFQEQYGCKPSEYAQKAKKST
ncbi:MAG: AraC family transcriptional regulator, partial [Flavobacterium sp.]